MINRYYSKRGNYFQRGVKNVWWWGELVKSSNTSEK